MPTARFVASSTSAGIVARRCAGRAGLQEVDPVPLPCLDIRAGRHAARCARLRRRSRASTRQQFSLVPIAVDTWGPLIFVNPDTTPRRSATRWATYRAGRRNRARPEPHRCGSVDAYDIKANWKVVVDNYLECYHCPVAHPGFCDLIDLDQYVIQEYDLFSTQTGPPTDKAKMGDAAGLYSDRRWCGERLLRVPMAELHAEHLSWPRAMSRSTSFSRWRPGRPAPSYEYCFVDEVAEHRGHRLHRLHRSGAA